MTTLFFWVGLSIAVALAASHRFDRSPGGWLVLSLIVSPLLAGAFLLAVGAKPAARPRLTK